MTENAKKLLQNWMEIRTYVEKAGSRDPSVVCAMLQQNVLLSEIRDELKKLNDGSNSRPVAG